jgi:MoxR-like ATPase
MPLRYNRIFRADKPISRKAEMTTTAGDRRDGQVYVYDEKIELAVNVALATSRPLLVRGPSGSGKSSLALNVALKLGRRFYEHVISSVTEARDLLWRFDSVRQLSDANVASGKEYPPNRYLQPGPLWWAFDPESARLRGLEKPHPDVSEAKDPAKGVRKGAQAVVLLDEIDKADPDVPNNLLVPLGSLQFSIAYPERTISAPKENAPLVIITTNEERELPAAFLRRCVVVAVPRPDKKKLLEIAAKHYEGGNAKLFESIADKLADVARAKKAKKEPEPSTAEYLDAISACQRLQIKVGPDSEEWNQIVRAILEKPQAATESATPTPAQP